MSALFYLAGKQLVNTIKELLRSPGKLAAYAIVVALILFSLLSSSTTNSGGAFEGAPLAFLHGGYFLLLLFIFVVTLMGGLKKGTTFFGMSDVNYIFPSPLSNKLVLFYGLVKQLASSLLIVLFLLVYGPMLMRNFTLTWGGVAALFVGFFATLFFAQVLALLIYGFTSSSPARTLFVKGLLAALAAAAVLIVAGTYLGAGGGFPALFKALESPLLGCLPVVGWVKAAAFGVITSSINTTLIYGAVTALGFAACLLVFVKGNIDYYEDVLQNTETMYSAKQSVKEGRMPSGVSSTRRVKVGQTGLRHGWGASAIFYRQLCEARRRSRLPLVGLPGIGVALISAVAAYMMTMGGGDSSTAMLVLLCVNAYILFFLNMYGDWSRELLKPYVFLIPEPPFKKLCWATLSSFLQPTIAGLLIFVLSGVAAGASVSAIAAGTMLYAGMGLLYISTDVLSMRVLGSYSNKGLILVIYLGMVAILFAPGAIASAVLLYSLHIPAVVAALPSFIWNVGVSMGIFAISRNVLSNAEYTL